ncbi:hypothetical protein C8Q77DRAFT_1133686, partial [Trametes polyzona]
MSTRACLRRNPCALFCVIIALWRGISLGPIGFDFCDNRGTILCGTSGNVPQDLGERLQRRCVYVSLLPGPSYVFCLSDGDIL